MRVPYWSQLPPAIRSEGLKPVMLGPAFRFSWNSRSPAPFDSYLLVSPGNPDSYIESQEFFAKLQESRMPVIHDAAYNTRAYTGFLHANDKFDSDVEIYSFSKMFGLSGLRVGYCVVRNDDIYKHMLEYIETKTVGVSSLSQNFVLSAMQRGDYPVSANKTLMNVFEDAAKLELRASADQFKRLEKLKPHHHLIGPMFGWFKNEGVDFVSAKVHVMDGKHFGCPDFVRINFAAGVDACREAVDRILAAPA
jgi:aspartate/methionine/tyrosine aminotransferase